MEQLRTKGGFVRRAITKAILRSTPCSQMRPPLCMCCISTSSWSWRSRPSSSSSTAQYNIRSQMQTWKQTRPHLLSTNKRLASPRQACASQLSRVHRFFLVLPRNFPLHCTQRPLPPRPVLPATSFSRVALPKLHIASFSGERHDWQAFWDQYQASIHGKHSLLKIGKFQYLLTYLSGSAKIAIQGIRLAEANYDVAMKVLSDRFSRRDMLVDDHLDHLLEMAPIRSSADLNKLGDLYDEITFRTSALEGLGVSPDEYTAVQRRVIMKALPPDLGILYRQRLQQASSSNHDDTAAITEDKSKLVKHVLTFLRFQVEAREESNFGKDSLCASQRLHRRES
ncbi:hypothetical protein HPB49_006802 [Dermacentor silvarum]|uniref:Uncharacterized protein n=1 Tax=Dermacentor silvarum TaxID=543639 RepID=A0ACB8DNG6_DERSI|nr:hypothetical protein HPB49_006802 [Dermacentor silvarum]